MTRHLGFITALALAPLTLAACGDRTRDRPAQADPAPVPGAAPAAPPTAGPAVASESREFRDWRATCDNGNACVAYTGGDSGWLRVGMDAGADAAPSVSLGIPALNGTTASSVALVIDGRRHGLRAGPADTFSFDVAPGEVGAVLSELAAASTITATWAGESASFPTAGASASLLWIDERQGRLNTTTALIRRGPQPASAVPAAPALPVITAAPAISQAGFEGNAPRPLPATLEALGDVEKCREDTNFNDYIQKAVTAVRLDASTEMWGVPCGAGAYNIVYSYFLTGAKGANPRNVDFPGSNGQVVTTEYSPDGLVNPIYDPATRTITAFSKARGIGDCGALQTWTWTGRGFVMSREQIMGDCWGMVSDFWPTTYRSR